MSGLETKSERWFRHEQSRASGYTVQWMLKMELPARRRKRKTSEKIHGCSEGGHTEVLV